MKPIMRQTLLEIKLFLRRKDELFWIVVFPIFFIVIFGLLYGETTWTFESGPMRAISYILPGIITMALMVSGIMATAPGFVEEREKGVYRRLSLTPLKRHVIIIGQLVQRYLVILVQCTLLITIGTLAFNTNVTGNLFLVWIVISIGAFSFLCIGFMLTVFIKTARAANGIAIVIFFMLMFLGGVFFPTDMMPAWLNSFAGILPSTNINDALREVAINAVALGNTWQELLIVTGWGIASLFVAIRLFRWE